MCVCERKRKVVFWKARSDGSEFLLTVLNTTKGTLKQSVRGGVKPGSIAVHYSFQYSFQFQCADYVRTLTFFFPIGPFVLGHGDLYEKTNSTIFLVNLFMRCFSISFWL